MMIVLGESQYLIYSGSYLIIDGLIVFLLYGVYDLFDKKLTIKQDKEKYIFAVSWVNKFAVDGKVNLQTLFFLNLIIKF